MKSPIKIMHIDDEYQVVYMIIMDGVLIKSEVPLESAIFLLKKEDFDLILSEPQNIALLNPEPISAP